MSDLVDEKLAGKEECEQSNEQVNLELIQFMHADRTMEIRRSRRTKWTKMDELWRWSVGLTVTVMVMNGDGW